MSTSSGLWLAGAEPMGAGDAQRMIWFLSGITRPAAALDTFNTGSGPSSGFAPAKGTREFSDVHLLRNPWGH